MRDNEAHWKLDAISEELRSIATGLSEDQAARRAAPPVGDDGLPPLAAPKGPFADYSAEEVEAYAKHVQREAYEAGRRAAVPAQTGTQQPAGDSIPPEDDRPERDWKKWIAGRAGLGPGAVPERIFFAGWFAGRRAAVSTASASEHADWCIGGAKGPCNCRTPSSPVE